MIRWTDQKKEEVQMREGKEWTHIQEEHGRTEYNGQGFVIRRPNLVEIPINDDDMITTLSSG
jgi:hypothetical protein